MKHRRHLRVLIAAAVASALAVGPATGAGAALPGTEPVVKTSTTAGALTDLLAVAVTDSVATTAPTTGTLLTELAGPTTSDLTEAQSSGGVGGVGGVGGGGVDVQGTLPQDDVPTLKPPSTAKLWEALTNLVDSAVANDICPADGAATAACGQAFAVIEASSPCLRPFVEQSDQPADCAPLVEATTQLALLIADEGIACANGENAVCKTAQDGAIGAAGALLRCVGIDPAPFVEANRESVVTGRSSLVDAYALCVQVVSAATAAAAEAVSAAQACVAGNNALCADVVATVLLVVDATVRCLDPSATPPTSTGTPLIAADVAGACAQALDTGRETLTALGALVQDCASNPEGTCQTVIGVAADTADAIKAEAESAQGQASRCLNGEGDATGELVRACQDVQDRIAGAIHDTDLAFEQEGVADVAVSEGDVGLATQAGIVAQLPITRDATTLDLVVEARRTVREVDDAGNVLSEKNEDLESLTYTAADSAVQQQVGGNGSCVMNGDELKKKAIKAYPPVRSPRDYSELGIDFQYTTHLYQSDMARPMIGVGWTWQVEGCQYGGADTYDGYRLRKTGAGMTMEEGKESRIDQSWASGDDKSSLQASLYAHVGSEASPVQIGGSIQQTSTGSNVGSSGAKGPYRLDYFDAYRHNAVVGWWRSNCRFTLPKYCGSRDFQASLDHGLWEWPRTDPETTKWMLLGYYWERACTAQGGCPVGPTL